MIIHVLWLGHSPGRTTGHGDAPACPNPFTPGHLGPPVPAQLGPPLPAQPAYDPSPSAPFPPVPVQCVPGGSASRSVDGPQVCDAGDVASFGVDPRGLGWEDAPPDEPGWSDSSTTVHRRRVLGLVGVALVGALFGGLMLFGGSVRQSQPSLAKVGDCVAGVKAEEIEVVGCDDGDALYRIVGRIDKMSRADWDRSDSACQVYPAARTSFWEGTSGAVGYALCLAPLQ